jgi:ABC-type Fe3+ transport system permease subunit
MGLTDSQLLLQVEVPLALPEIMAGLRIATTTTVGLATLAFFAGAGGLGEQIFADITFKSNVVVAGGLALTLLSLLLLVAPYRIMLHNEAERVSVGSRRCYLVGQRDPDALVFCPNQPPPWSRIVRLDDPQLKRDGIRENMFTEVE